MSSRAGEPPKELPESLAAREEAQAYFEDNQPRKAAAALAAAAARDPGNRVLGTMLYAAVRDHVWNLPETLPIKHGGAVETLVFSADGKKIATGAASGEVFISSTEPLDEADAAKERLALPKEESAIVGLSFTKDEKRLAVVTKEGGLRIWDTAAKKPVFEEGKPAQPVTVARRSSRGGIFVIATAGGVIQAVDIEAGKVIAEFHMQGGAVTALAMSRSGMKLAAAGSDHMVRVWNLETAKEIGKGLPHQGAVIALDFSADERYVLTAGEEKIARLWNPEEGVMVMPAMSCGETITKARVSPDGSMIGTLLGDGSVQFWDALTGAKLPVSLHEEAPMNDFVWARTGMRAATASSDGHATIWTTRNGAQRGERILHGGPVLVMTFSPDDKVLATGTADGEARLWRTNGGMPLTTVRNHNARARTAFYSADGQHLVTASEDHTALHWISGHVDPYGPAMQQRGKVTCAVFNADASRILTSDTSGDAQLWDAKKGRVDGKPYHHSAAVNWVDFAPNENRLVTAAGPRATVWSFTDRTKPLAVIQHPGKKKSELKCARFSPDGKLLVTVSTDGTARIWDAKTWRPVSVINRHNALWCARFSPDGSRMVVTGDDVQAVVYDTKTWKPVGTPVLAPGPVFSAVITEDNRFLAITSLLLEAVQFFEIDSGRPLGEGVNLHTQATCIDYLVQDKVVVVACDDGTVRAIEAPFVAQDVPAWMPAFAERLVGLHRTGPDTFERVLTHMAQLHAMADDPALPAEADFTKLARWELASGSDRHGMPRFTSTLADNIVHRVNERSLGALFECYEAISADALVLSGVSLYLPNARHGEFIADMVLKMPDATPLARCYAASTLINAGRGVEALAVVTKAVADAPGDARVLRRAAKVEARMQNMAEAVALFDKSLEIEPDNFETRRAYGWVLYYFQRPAQAAVQFMAAQDLAGEMVDDVIAGLCLCARAQKNDMEALADYHRLVALDPAWKEASYLSDLRGWTQGQLEELERVRRAYVAKK
ncbi:WD40 repeat domain-containing protein [Chthoniobacter flavus]|uniref:WD40 repeat domain-containing protein n=1 Tax=Chthoniobacter flavus TaxID=191863 RepID=UPI000305C9D1|nr:hypothetical protein [Chthoniobacter flavus]